jgi:hypothetical protein
MSGDIRQNSGEKGHVEDLLSELARKLEKVFRKTWELQSCPCSLDISSRG